MYAFASMGGAGGTPLLSAWADWLKTKARVRRKLQARKVTDTGPDRVFEGDYFPKIVAWGMVLAVVIALFAFCFLLVMV